MIPLWLYSDGYLQLQDTSKLPPLNVLFMFLLNGIGCFVQNLLAFSVLSIVSPVTYSIASLVKRIFIISASILWFGDSVTYLQGFGIGLTFTGLWLYERARHDVQMSEARLSGGEDVVLPTVCARSGAKRKSINEPVASPERRGGED